MKLRHPLSLGLLTAVILLTACSKPAEPEPTIAVQESEPEVPMSAEPAEPTGVMNVEPTVMSEASIETQSGVQADEGQPAQ